MTRNATSQSVRQLRSSLGQLRFTLIGMITITSLFCLPFILIPAHRNALIALGFSPFLFFIATSALKSYYNGRTFWWFAFAISVCSLSVITFALGFIFLLQLRNLYFLTATLGLLFLFSILSWRQGAGCFTQEMMQHVLASKRIDVEKGTYSPFVFPFGILTTKSSMRWFVIANTAGPLVISLTLLFSHWLGKYSPKAENLWTALCAYVGVILFVYTIRTALGEYSWIRRWEKETGRKMYISYVVDWKRYKEEEKKRKQAQKN